MSEPQTHDYRDERRCWGHDITYRPTASDGLAASGWGSGIAAGDHVLLSNGAADTRYRVVTITYYPDPPDMWRATLAFAPRPVMAHG